MKKWFLWVPLIIFVLFCAVFVNVILTARQGLSEYMKKPLPVFQLPILGQPEYLRSDRDLQGEITLVNFWASWCPPCREEHPVLVKIEQDYKVRMVGINFKDDPNDAQKWLADYGNPYVFTLADTDGKAGIEWGVIAIPETYLVDAHGLVRYKHTGPITLAKWEKEIWPLICSWTNNAGAKCSEKAKAAS